MDGTCTYVNLFILTIAPRVTHKHTHAIFKLTTGNDEIPIPLELHVFLPSHLSIFR